MLDHHDILTFEEIQRVVRAAAELGIHKVRITGGEPLARIGIADLVRRIAAIPSIDDISMTTNGHLLTRYADELAAAGLHRVNISLDSLREDRFRVMTRLGTLGKVWEGLAAAEKAGLTPIKLNVVVIRGLNDDEVLDFAQMTLQQARHVRFIEVMPLGHNDLWAEDGYVAVDEVRDRIETKYGPLEAIGPSAVPIGNGPARYWRLPGAPGTLGFISPISDHFCARCNRLRLTADGRLRPCLLSDAEIDLRVALRESEDDLALRELINQAVADKPARHRLGDGEHPVNREMAQIGG